MSERTADAGDHFRTRSRSQNKKGLYALLVNQFPVFPASSIEREKGIRRTRTGLLILAVGTLFAWIPDIGGYGILILLVGAVLIVLSRTAFGPRHSRNAVLSVILSLSGFLAGILVAFTVGLIESAGLSSSSGADLFRIAFETAHASTITVTAVAGFAPILITFALQDRRGQILLMIAYVANLVAQIVIRFVMAGALSVYASEVIAAGRTLNGSSLSDFEARFSFLDILGAIPAVLYASAFFLAWSRITKGNTPELSATHHASAKT